MLKRTLEPEVMDTLEEAVAYDDMNHSEVNRCFVEELLATGELGEQALDLGTGTARIPLELCRHTEELKIVAVDMAVAMLEIARRNLEIHGAMHRVRLERLDAKQLPFPDGHFSLVMSNSILHHIPEPRTVLREAVRVCQPQGLLFFRDLMRPDDSATLDQLVEAYAARESDHARRMFRDSLHAALRLSEMRELVAEFGFSPESVRATSDRHWTWSARR